MVRETAYDEVFDAQKHYRSLLDSMSRPGKINRLDPVHLNQPAPLNSACVLVAFALLDSDSTFDLCGMNEAAAEYLHANTNARHTATDEAHFLFAPGTEAPDFLESANCGTLLYPDTSATVVLQLESASTEPLSDSLKLTIEGPGVNGRAELFVRGLNPDLLLAIEARNAEFPLGLDTILTFDDSNGVPCVACLPRTSRVAWEKC